MLLHNNIYQDTERGIKKEIDNKVIGLLIHIKHILEFNLYNLTHKITEMLIFQCIMTADFSLKE